MFCKCNNNHFHQPLSSSVSDIFSDGLITGGPGLVLSLKGGTNADLGTPFFTLPLPLPIHAFGDFILCVLKSIIFEFFVCFC